MDQYGYGQSDLPKEKPLPQGSCSNRVKLWRIKRICLYKINGLPGKK